MSFRLRIVLVTTVLMTLLFSVGGTALIHSSFQTSLEKEEEAVVELNEMILRVVAYVGKDGTWITQEELAGVMENLSQQDTLDGLWLMHGEELIYMRQKGKPLSDYRNQVGDLEENEVLISYFTSEEQEHYVQSSARFELNNRSYHLDICRNLTDIYETREAQIQLFQNIFFALSVLGMFVSWGAATFLTRHLRKLTKATKEIAGGNLSYRSKIHSSDEVGELAEAFDGMAEKLEKNITLLKESAEQKEMFIGAFTHEMKTPMTSIIGYADLLRTQKLNPRDEAEALDYIFSEGKRLENMSLKMLDLFVADKKDVILQKGSPAKLVHYTVKHMRAVYQKSHIELEVKADDGECWLEPDLFQTLLINLLDNAKKAMEQGGKIVVTVKMTAQGCVLSVTDNGRGIPQEALGHLTEAFYRVDKARARSRGSAGLGLALCEKIVELHQGHMEFSSEEGVGTVVTVTLWKLEFEQFLVAGK